MNYEPALPNPLRHKIAGWNLPTTVELAVLESLERQITSIFLTEGQTEVKTFDCYTNDPLTNEEYDFFVQYTLTMHRGNQVVLDLIIERVGFETDE